MSENPDQPVRKNKTYNKKVFTVPLIICGIGLLICFMSSLLSDNIDAAEAAGFILLSVGTGMALNALVKEKYRLGMDIHFPLNIIFPSYPIVEDYDQLTRDMSSFKSVYNEFMSSTVRNKSNSKIQDYATQLLWHCIYLQKRRMEKLGVQMELESSRRSYSKEPTVRSASYFDGKYNINDVYEEIYAIRTFFHGGRKIKNIYDKEVAHYTFLSAKSVGKDDVVCPNCSNIASRSNLIDGCDFCGTKFTVEDLDNRVGSFGFRRDFQVSDSQRKAIKKLIYPRIYLGGMMPMFYIGFFLPFLYGKDMNFLLRFAMGLFCGAGLGFAGFALVSFAMFFIAPVVLIFNQYWDFLSNRIIYRPHKEQEKEIRMAKKVRKSDPLFSIQSFLGGIQNKLYAIHFADTKSQVNAFSDCNLSRCFQKYRDIVDIDTLSLSMDSYEKKEGIQKATVSATLVLREFKNKKIADRKEILKIGLEKNEDCKTQTVCAPSILKCGGCGSSLSLMDGKTCEYCGRELDMKEYDWVITNYDIVQSHKQ